MTVIEGLCMAEVRSWQSAIVTVGCPAYLVWLQKLLTPAALLTSCCHIIYLAASVQTHL